MPIHPQVKPVVQFGTPTEITGQVVQEAGIFSVDSSDVVRVTKLDLSQLIIGGSGAIATKYYVNVLNSIPVTGYTSIQTAINAAVADGHNQGSPAVIIPYPGKYTEDITLPVGISIQGLVQDVGDMTTSTTDAGVRITGTVTVSPASSGGNALVNLRIVGRVIAGGTATAGLVMDSVFVLQGGGFAATDAAMTATNPSLSLMMVNCYFVGAVGATWRTFYVPAATTVVSARNCLFNAPPADLTKTAFEIDGSATATLRNCVIRGRFFVVTGGAELQDSTITVTGAFSAFGFATGGAVSMFGGYVSCAHTDLAAGTGTLRMVDVGMTSVPGILPTTVTTTASIVPVIRPMKEIVIAPAGVITTLDTAFTMDATAGNTTINLLALTTVPRGYEINIKKVSVANTVTVTASVPDTIDLAATFVLAAGKMSSVTLRAAGGGDWHIVAAY